MPGIIFQRKSLTENKLMFPIFPSCTSLHTLHTSVFPLFPALRSQYITEVHLLKISQFEKTKTFNCAATPIYQRPSCNFCKYKQFKAGHIVLVHRDNWDKATLYCFTKIIGIKPDIYRFRIYWFYPLAEARARVTENALQWEKTRHHLPEFNLTKNCQKWKKDIGHDFDKIEVVRTEKVFYCEKLAMDKRTEEISDILDI